MCRNTRHTDNGDELLKYICHYLYACICAHTYIHAMVTLMPDLYALYLCTYLHAMVTLMHQSVCLVSLHLHTCHGHTNAPICMLCVSAHTHMPRSHSCLNLYAVSFCTYIPAMVTLTPQAVRLVSLHLHTCYGHTDGRRLCAGSSRH